MKKQQNTLKSSSALANENRIIEKVLKSVEKKKQDKYIEYNLSTTVGTTLVYICPTDAIAQGASESQRIGNKIRLKRFKLRFIASVADTTNYIRFVAFRWKVSTSSDVPSNPEIFLPNSSYGIQSQFLPTKPSRFQVVFDRTISLSTQGPACTAYDVDVPLNWDTSYDVGTNLGKDHLYFVYWSDSALVNHPAMAINLLLHYHDTV